MSLKDIEKLKEKVDKDPNSKLFVPLAEEYRKEGMLDEAVQVLLAGLEKQPGYVSARVSLGKIYLEKGQLAEARAEFEHVIRAIPDNLFAQKKLAELYRDTGERDLAIKSFKMVLNLNPKDEDSLMQLKDLESMEEQPAALETDAGPQPAAAEAPLSTEAAFGEITFSDDTGEPAFPEELPAEENAAEDDLSAFKDSIFGVQQEAVPEEAASAFDEEVVELKEEDAVQEEAISFEDFQTEMPAEPHGEADISEHLIVEEIKAGPFSQEKPSAAVQEDFATIEQAEQYIGTGDYASALGIYRRMLTANPDDRKALQRVEELKGLLKLMGKDKEALIARMNAFLESIGKRRDEFLRRS